MHVKGSKTFLDCGFHPVDSGFQVLNNGLLICEIPVFSGIPKGKIPNPQAKTPRSPESYSHLHGKTGNSGWKSQMVHAIPFVKRQMLWAAILGDAIFPLSHVCSVDWINFVSRRSFSHHFKFYCFMFIHKIFHPSGLCNGKHPLHGAGHGANCWYHAICVGANS